MLENMCACVKLGDWAEELFMDSGIMLILRYFVSTEKLLKPVFPLT